MSSQTWSKWGERMIFMFIGYLITQISPPLFADIYKVTLKKWFFESKAAVIVFAASTTTLHPLDNYGKNRNYYEITSFKIVSVGKELDSDAKLKIEARGEILGITPDTIKNKLEIQKDDPTQAFLRIGGLEPGEELKGEIHSYAKMSNDRNKSTIGFDSTGKYRLMIKAD